MDDLRSSSIHGIDDRPVGNQKISILLIEDTPDHAELAHLSLKKVPGCEIQFAETMNEARDLISEFEFDVILSDLNLPDSGREETVQNIRTLAPQSALIILTCDRIDQHGSDSIAAGAQTFIRKEELASTPLERVILHALGRQRAVNDKVTLTNELLKKNTELEIARKEAECAINAKADFLASVSHEMRTPMTAILGFIEVALETQGVLADPEALSALQTVHRNSKHLLAMINDILDVTKVESGAIVLEHNPCSIKESVCSIVEILGLQAQEKGLELVCEFAPDIHEWFLLDETRLKQILMNLVGNAIKFTADGTVSIKVSSCDQGLDTHQILIEVHDTGVGLTNEEIQIISAFDLFVQANAGITREYGGTGLGLRISHGLAELMGGTINIQSQAGQGSVFSLELQAIGTQFVSESSRVPEKQELCRIDGLRVLVVDDSRDNRLLISHFLRRAGGKIEMASDGQQAIDMIIDSQCESFDLVLMDIQMPKIDGYQAIKAIREHRIHTPIYATSASAMSNRSCQDAGFNGFLSKPIDRSELLKLAMSVLIAQEKGSGNGFAA